MVRRRLSRLTKMALEVCDKALEGQEEKPTYAVFCSRHGELNRTVTLLSCLARDEPLSPMLFAQSVHNTASGLFGITNKCTIPTTSISARYNLVESGWIESYAYLCSHPDSTVLLVVFDEIVPEIYHDVVPPGVDLAYALLLRVHSSTSKVPTLSLRHNSQASKGTEAASPFDIALVDLIRTGRQGECYTPDSQYIWQRH
jgi:hypothetical protein